MTGGILNLDNLKGGMRAKDDESVCSNVDSLIDSAYDSQKALEWGQIKNMGLPIDAPQASYQTVDEHNVYNSSE